MKGIEDNNERIRELYGYKPIKVRILAVLTVTWTSYHNVRSVRYHNAYSSLQYFATWQAFRLRA
jgi:hypothetical protein